MSDKAEIDYYLQSPIKYARSGEELEAVFVRLSAPSGKNSRECLLLKQAFFQSLPRGEETKEEKPAQELTGEMAMEIIAMSSDVNLSEVVDVGRDLFLRGGVALVDGEEKLTKPLWDSMGIDDVQGMLGEYLVNFILASFVRRIQKS